MEQKNKPYSFYALIIAFGVHILVVLVFVLFFLYISESVSSSPPPPPPAEKRVKLSLKEKPTVAKEALVKNEIPKTTRSLPIPRGKQLVEPIAPILEAEAFEPENTDQDMPTESAETYENKMIQELYGDVFTNLSAGEQKFIMDNQETMRRITQDILARYAPYRIPPDLEVDESNMVEFYLHPDGSVTDLRFLTNSRFELLDNVTLETLEIAYKKYPRPEQPTLIRYRIEYLLRTH
ncbi:energy transducer TonB [Sulfuricurvum sp.]|uniref:energy transducer TonB family protein n=1 Tax=Sulfuricurvum sp. TaxID=2025608 RepID=UPI002605E3F8|nr:energy transducer TonB [Sulfuricurvum sp.]MDD2780352.1 TonB family protein [Sulfuricurvum sp.]